MMSEEERQEFLKEQEEVEAFLYCSSESEFIWEQK